MHRLAGASDSPYRATGGAACAAVKAGSCAVLCALGLASAAWAQGPTTAPVLLTPPIAAPGSAIGAGALPPRPGEAAAVGIGAGSAGAPGSRADAVPPPGGVPFGQGPGVHSPNSPFAPLPPRADVVPWSVLTSAKTRVVNKRVLPDFTASQTELAGKKQRVQGFMLPLQPGERQRHFLLTSVPLTCSFCVAGGPESMVEVRTAQPVKYTMEPVVVEGRFAVLADDPYGLFYRITEAVAVK